MRLVSRVSAFFLAALAAALVGYSAATYYLISSYLYRQFDADLHGALDLLAASVEVEPDDAKWHPAEHGINLAQPVLEQSLWIVCDETGQVIDHSPRLVRRDPQFRELFEFASLSQSGAGPVELGDLRVVHRTLAAPTPKPLSLREPHEFMSVRITVGRSLSELGSTLSRLALLLTAVPAGVWLISAVGGRWFVRKALSPVRAMAERAQSTTQADFQLRLPVNASGDELAELGDAFNRLLDQLQEAFDRQRRFTSDAAHQLRTPLTVLLGQIDVARRRTRTSDEYQRTLDLLADEASQLAQTVESLLFMARAEQGALPPDMDRVAIDEWLRDYVQRWSTHPRAKDLTTRFDANREVVASRTLLAQALDNLLTNAFNYSEPGTPVTFTSAERDGEVFVSVKDRGMGITAADRDVIFEPFFRSPEARGAGVAGTGLGLPLSARIIRLFQGRLTCQSSAGEGSEFCVILPAATTADKVS